MEALFTVFLLYFCFCGFLCIARVFPFYLLLLLASSFCLFVLFLVCFSAFPLRCFAFPFLRLSALPRFFLPSACVCFAFSACSCFCFCFSAFCFSAFLLRSCAPPLFCLSASLFLSPPSSFRSRPAPLFSCLPFWLCSAPKHKTGP